MIKHDFFTQFARTLNSKQSRSLILYGNVYDLFFDGEDYTPLIDFLCKKTQVKGLIQIKYELNGPIRFVDYSGKEKIKAAWITWRCVNTEKADFEKNLAESIGNATFALEFLRQLTIVSRSFIKDDNLLIIIEAADMLLPAGNGDLASLSDRHLRRISIMQDWFSDPAFVNGNDSVVLVAESVNLVHSRVSKLPQILAIDVPAPNFEQRKHFIGHNRKDPISKNLVGDWAIDDLAKMTAALSLHAIRQTLAHVEYGPLYPELLLDKIEEYIQSQVGEDVVEFKKPKHKLSDCIAFSALKKFLKEEFIPRIKAPKEHSLTGAAIAGPIGGGKTHIFEAVAGELDIPVLVLKNIRSQWYGQTDVIFERLRRALQALEKVVIFVDEADTVFGSLDSTEQATERRLTGKIQAMMSDSELKGKIVWLLMTARIHLLSPDIRRPGRVGDLIIPILDPTTEQDRRELVGWALEGLWSGQITVFDEVMKKTKDYSIAAYASLKSRLQAQKAIQGEISCEQALEIIDDQLPADIGKTREYQTLQAILNCTRKSLLPDSLSNRDQLVRQLAELEAQGIR